MISDTLTLQGLRDALAMPLADNAAFDGWNDRALGMAANAISISHDRARLAFPDGPRGMIDAWFAAIDRDMEQAVPAEQLAVMKTSDRIRHLIRARLSIARRNREALRRALTILALPSNMAHAVKLGWRTADGMWRHAGDQAADFNHYSKRATLAAIYTATLLVWIDDESEGDADTLAFLDRRLAGIARFEKAKARLKPDADAYFSPARFFGRLRYPTI